jgi:anti-anti-sigma regulatory factor
MLDDPRQRPGVFTVRPWPDRTGLIVAGEADLTVKDALRAALAALPADGTGDIHLDLAGLRFIDVACTRELIAAASRRPATRVVIHHPPAALLRITALLGADASISVTGAPRPLTPVPDQRSPAPGDAGMSPDGVSMPGGRPQGAKAVTDVIDLIVADRAQIWELLARISQLTGSCRDAPDGQAPGAGDRVLSQDWAALARLLTAHIDAEQEVCYLTMTAARPPADPRQAWIADLFDIREALAEARLSAIGSARWLRAVAAASAAAIRHFHAEDHYLLPVLGQAPAETRGLLARQWIAFTLARLQDDAEAEATGHCRTSLPGRHARPPALSPGAAPADTQPAAPPACPARSLAPTLSERSSARPGPPRPACASRTGYGPVTWNHGSFGK